MSNKFVNIVVIVFTFIFLGVKLSYFFYTNKNPEILSYPDEKAYYESGANAFKEQGFSYFLTKRSLYNGPLNILWVYIHPSYTTAKVSNIILMSLASLLLYFAFSTTFTHLTKIIAWLVFSAYPLINHYSGTILTEPPFIFLLVLSTFIFFRAKDNYFLYFLSGVALGLATLVRPTTQYFPFFIICIFILFFLLKKLSSFKINVDKKLTYSFLAFILGALLLTTPWIIKNKILFNKLGIATGSGAVIYLGNDHRKDGDEPIYSNMHFDTFEITKPYSHLDLEGDKKLTNEAIKIIKKHPLDFLLISLKKSIKLLFGYPMDYFERRTNIIDFQTHPKNKTYYANLLELVLHVFLSVSFLYFFFAKGLTSTGTIFLASIYLYFLCLHSVAFPIPRLFLPAIVFSMFSLPYVLNSKKSIFINVIFSIAVIVFISFFRINSTDEISKRRIKFFKLETPLVKKTETRGFDSNNQFLIANNKKRRLIVFNIEKVKSALNKVFFVNLSHTSNAPLKSNYLLNLYWDSGNGFSENNKVQLKYKGNHKGTYLASPCLSSNQWNNGIDIKRIKLVFNKLASGDKIKTNVFLGK